MTITTRPLSTRHRPGGRSRLALLASGGLLTGLVLSGGSFALWSDSDDVDGGQIVAGNLDITLDGETIWNETSTDVDNPQQPLDPADFLVRPGDTFEISQDFSTDLQGDNMLAGLKVSWGDPAELPDGVQASYVVVNPRGDDSGPADLGTAVELDAVPSDNAGHSDGYTLVIDLEFTENVADRFSADADAVLANLGQIVLDLEQTRTGEGFNS